MAEIQKLEVANCDFKIIDNINIESLIRIVRGQRVMLDADLAMLYGVETKVLNQAVKRNVNRFPDDFRRRTIDIGFDGNNAFWVGRVIHQKWCKMGQPF